jgi:hypothetical protein
MSRNGQMWAFQQAAEQEERLAKKNKAKAKVKKKPAGKKK